MLTTTDSEMVLAGQLAAVQLPNVERDPIKRSRIDEILIAEGRRWRRQGTWIGGRVDPAFENRGALNRSTPRRPRAVS